jgi:pilus assembly protein CpaE
VRKALGLDLPWHGVSDAPHEVQAAINAGLPLAQAQRGSAVVRELAAWADGLSPQAHQESIGLLQRLFRRA